MVHELFDAVDANKSGTVDTSDLKTLTGKCIGVELDDAAIAQCLSKSFAPPPRCS